MRIIKAAEGRRTKWKNGGGTTTEIAVHPSSAGLDDFGWRASVAEVSSDGPFSRFEGVDRTLTVLSGEGLALDVDGQAVQLDPFSEPFGFDGGSAVSARLADGPVTDFNVMTRRGQFRHGVRSLVIEQQLPIQATDAGTLIYCRSGGLNIEGAELTAGDAVFLPEGSLVADPNGRTELLLVELVLDR